MRILIVVHSYPPTHNGGAERRAERTARVMHARGHDVRVLCVKTTEASHSEVRWEEEAHNGVLVRRISYNPIIGRVPWRWSYDTPQLGAVLADMIDSWTPDLVHLFSGYLMSASTINVSVNRGVPVIVSLTDYFWICHQLTLVRSNGHRCAGSTPIACARCLAEERRSYHYLREFLPGAAELFWGMAEQLPQMGAWLGVDEQVERVEKLRLALGRAAALIAPSHYLAEQYERHGIIHERLYVWRQGVELDLCPLREPSETLRVGYIGQVKPHKGVHTLLDAWQQLRSNRPRQLLIYGSPHGDDAYAQAIHKQIARSEHVAWHGEFRAQEVWQVLAQLDVLVVPSRWPENSPNCILEAQAMGVPIIGTNLGGIAELVTNEVNGLLFAADSSDDLARQLQRLLDEPGLLPILRHGSLDVQHITHEMDRLEALYDELYDNRRTHIAEMPTIEHIVASGDPAGSSQQ